MNMSEQSLPKNIEEHSQEKRNWRFYSKHGLVALIGFILSPFTWWNDLVINVPLAYAFAYFFGWLSNFFMKVQRGFFVILFFIGYWLTNVIGLYMLEKGIIKIALKERKNFRLVWHFLIAFAYSLIVAILIYFDFHDVLSNLKILPDWVK